MESRGNPRGVPVHKIHDAAAGGCCWGKSQTACSRLMTYGVLLYCLKELSQGVPEKRDFFFSNIPYACVWKGNVGTIKRVRQWKQFCERCGGSDGKICISSYSLFLLSYCSLDCNMSALELKCILNCVATLFPFVTRDYFWLRQNNKFMIKKQLTSELRKE